MRASSLGWRSSSWSSTIWRFRMYDPAWTGWPCGRLEYNWRCPAVRAGKKRRPTLRPSSVPSRLSMALMDLLQLRGRPRSKIGGIFNFQVVLGLHALEPLLIFRLLHRLNDGDESFVEGLLVDLFGTHQVKTVRLPDRCA